MLSCSSRRDHKFTGRPVKNELGRWYQCALCGSTILVPNIRWRLILKLISLYGSVRKIVAHRIAGGKR